ncbi:MAG: tRNA (adenosine(37)-N6)-dimethylallyltransferase MiaA [Firmicutes bacterium]|nr:tRNA (adenosine(37)-N6)-dimethylallyltransferase MiaA [Bacillota bacterium]
MVPILVIVGPTAVGKTQLSIEVAQRVDGEIISADSMQIYRGLDIGTAKPTEEEREGIPHHMMDIVEPWEEYSVAEYQAMVEDILQEVALRDKVPILTGGTGLYIRAVLEGFIFDGEGKDEAFRTRMQLIAETQGNEALHSRLQAIDPQTANRLHPNDLRRVIRALEVYETTGVPLSRHLQMQSEQPPRHKSIKFGLMRDRKRLYERIDARVDMMLEKGLLAEVQHLLDRGLSNESTAMQALGYKELVAYLRGEYDRQEAVRLLKRDTRRYAKRQLTWFRRDRNIIWLNLDKLSTEEAVEQITSIYWRNCEQNNEI